MMRDPGNEVEQAAPYALFSKAQKSRYKFAVLFRHFNLWTEIEMNNHSLFQLHLNSIQIACLELTARTACQEMTANGKYLFQNIACDIDWSWFQPCSQGLSSSCPRERIGSLGTRLVMFLDCGKELMRLVARLLGEGPNIPTHVDAFPLAAEYFFLKRT